ncbi:MAG: rod shape-determining protein MreC [Caulobacterales bacterium]
MARLRRISRRSGAPRVTIGVIVGALLMIGALVLIGLSASKPHDSPALHAGDDVAAAAARGTASPASDGEGLFSRIFEMWNATNRIEQLEKENRELQAWKELAQRLAERNSRYEALLRMPPDSFGSGADIENSIAAQLVLDSGGPFTRTLVANAGADHGVRIGYIAVNEAGLVGRVVSLGKRSSRILMLDDYNSRIPVMGAASRVRAVLVGQATQPPELLTRPFVVESPRLDFIVGAQNLREGERIITSGDGGIYPRGLPLGIARLGRDGAWRVALAASQQPIDFVRIIPHVGPETPEDAPTEAEPPPLNGREPEISRILTPAPAAAETRRSTAAPPARPQTPTSAPAPAPADQPSAPPPG